MDLPVLVRLSDRKRKPEPKKPQLRGSPVLPGIKFNDAESHSFYKHVRLFFHLLDDDHDGKITIQEVGLLIFPRWLIWWFDMMLMLLL